MPPRELGDALAHGIARRRCAPAPGVDVEEHLLGGRERLGLAVAEEDVEDV
jgi:hypothetical protein